MRIEFTLPGREPQARMDFARLAALMGQTVEAEKPEFSPDLSARDRPFTTSFKLDEKADKASLHFKKKNGIWNYPAEKFLDDTSGHDVHMSFADATRRLKGHVQQIDHITVCVPNTLPNTDWLRVVEPFSATGILREYPEGADGYDPKKNLWYVMAEAEQPREVPPTTKFVLAYDDNPHSQIHIGLQTTLPRAKIKEYFPKAEQLRDLGKYFLSVNITTLWPGMRTIRLDLRGDFDPEWASDDYLSRKTAPVAPGTARLPLFKPSFVRPEPTPRTTSPLS